MIAHHHTISGQIKAIPGSRQVSAIISTESPDRAGDIVRSRGCDYAGFSSSPTVLWNHDQSTPIAKAITLDVGFKSITSVAQFPAPGASAKSDEIFALVQEGVINATSIGFLPKKSKPLGGGRIDCESWVLLEWSFVSCPANDEALIIQRAARWAADHGGDEPRRRAEKRLGLQLRLLNLIGTGSLSRDDLKLVGPERARRYRELEVVAIQHGTPN